MKAAMMASDLLAALVPTRWSPIDLRTERALPAETVSAQVLLPAMTPSLTTPRPPQLTRDSAAAYLAA